MDFLYQFNLILHHFSVVCFFKISQVVNHVGLYASKAAKGCSAFQTLSCFWDHMRCCTAHHMNYVHSSRFLVCFWCSINNWFWSLSLSIMSVAFWYIYYFSPSFEAALNLMAKQKICVIYCTYINHVDGDGYSICSASQRNNVASFRLFNVIQLSSSPWIVFRGILLSSCIPSQWPLFFTPSECRIVQRQW